MIVTVYSNDESIDWGATGAERIVQNVRNILRTRPYEVPFMRDLGINQDFTDSTLQKIESELATNITEIINIYEPRAKVLDVKIEPCDESGDYIIAVELEV